MASTFPVMRKIVATTVVGGALMFGTAGAADAAGAAAPTSTATAGTSAATVQLTPGAKDRLPHFSCSRATKVLTKIQHAEAGIAAGLPKLHAAEAKATAAGETGKAARIGNRITRLGPPGSTTRLQRLAAAIEAKCNVAAPAIVPATAP